MVKTLVRNDDQLITKVRFSDMACSNLLHIVLELPNTLDGTMRRRAVD